MKPESAAYVEKAKEELDAAQKVARIGLAKVAARSAYYAGFHAAEAVIIELSGRAAKSHSGVRSEFARLTRQGTDFTKADTTFLAQAYKYKEIGDYGVGGEAEITMPEAENCLKSAQEFVARVEKWLVGP